MKIYDSVDEYWVDVHLLQFAKDNVMIDQIESFGKIEERHALKSRVCRTSHTACEEGKREPKDGNPFQCKVVSVPKTMHLLEPLDPATIASVKEMEKRGFSDCFILTITKDGKCWRGSRTEMSPQSIRI